MKTRFRVRFGFGRGPYLQSVKLGLYLLLWMPAATVHMVKGAVKAILTGEGCGNTPWPVRIVVMPVVMVTSWLIYTLVYPIAGLLGCIRLERHQSL